MTRLRCTLVTAALVLIPMSTRAQDPAIQSILSTISGDSIMQVITSLQGFGTRYALATNHRAVASWIRDKYISYGLTNTTLDSFYTSYTGWQYNVTATLTGTLHPDTVYILGGHYDSYASGFNYSNAPGADDNASGTAAAMEVARVLVASGYQPRCTIKFQAYAAEELGLYGSEYWANQAAQQNMRIKMMINNDMISYCSSEQNWRIALQQYSNSSTVTALASSVASTYTSLPIVLRNDDIMYSDSWSFYSEGFKTIFLQEYEFTPYYHTINDRIENSNMNYCAEMTKVSCGMLLSDIGFVTGIGQGPGPGRVVLHPNYPNPFNPTTTIQYELPSSGLVTLKVYNAMGQVVRTLVHAQRQSPGPHQVQWDGRADNGSVVAGGVYICRLETSFGSQTRKMTLLK